MIMKMTAFRKIIIAVVVLCVVGIIALFVNHINSENDPQGHFSLLPPNYRSYDLVYAEYKSEQINLSEGQIKDLVDMLSNYQAVTTEEIAFVVPYKNTAYFVITFFNKSNAAFYSIGICVGRNGTDECYAISNYSNMNYAQLSDNRVFYDSITALLASWGYR